MSRSPSTPQAIVSGGTDVGGAESFEIQPVPSDAPTTTPSPSGSNRTASTVRSGRTAPGGRGGPTTTVPNGGVLRPDVTVTIQPDGPTPVLDRVVGPGLYVVDRNGRNLRRISNRLDPYGGEFSWSPDGRRLSYAWRATPLPDGSSPSGQDGICVVNADGSGARDLDVSGVSPQWSPDGQRIAYSVGSAWSPTAVATIAPSGAGGAVTVASGATGPKWSPNGRLAYIASTGPQPHNLALRLRTNGVERTLVPDYATGAITWAPDGGRLTYRSSRSTGNGTHVIGADGSGDVAVDDRPIPNGMGNVSWSPDARFLASEHAWNNGTAGDGPHHVQVRNADGTNVRDVAQATYPAWSPRDDQLAIVDMRVPRADGTWDYDLQLIRPDGGARRTIVEDPPNLIIEQPSWSRDGHWIAFSVRHNAHPKEYEQPLHPRC